MTDRVGFKIVDVELNSVNGGSFSVLVAKLKSSRHTSSPFVYQLLKEEERKGLNSLKPYRDFKKRVFNHRNELRRFLLDIRSNNKTILGYGASTKGNVILQFCSITQNEIPFIAEVNTDKFGCYTPGTHIPIISEAQARQLNPDYFMVLPWHFKKNILEREKEYINSGGKLFFPLPFLEVIER